MFHIINCEMKMKNNNQMSGIEYKLMARREGKIQTAIKVSHAGTSRNTMISIMTEWQVLLEKGH